MKVLVIPLFILVLLIGFVSKKRVNSEVIETPHNKTSSTLSETALQQSLTKTASPYITQVEAFLSNRPAPDEVAPEWIDGLIEIVQQWAQQCNTPQEVIDLLLSLQPVELQETLLESAFVGFGHRDYKEALGLAYSLDEQGVTGLDEHLGWIVKSQISEKNYQEMSEFISNFPDESKRATLYDFAFDEWAENAPSSLGESLKTIPDESERNLYIAQLASVWARSNPEAASEYVLGLPSSEAKSNAFLNLVDSWGRQDPEAVADWIISRGEDSDLDLAVSSFAQFVDIEAYGAENVLSWAMSVTHPLHRTEAVSGVINKLKTSQPDLVTEWIANLEDDALRESLTSIQ